MLTYIEYKLDENTTILIEAPEDTRGGGDYATVFL